MEEEGEGEEEEVEEVSAVRVGGGRWSAILTTETGLSNKEAVVLPSTEAAKDFRIDGRSLAFWFWCKCECDSFVDMNVELSSLTFIFSSRCLVSLVVCPPPRVAAVLDVRAERVVVQFVALSSSGSSHVWQPTHWLVAVVTVSDMAVQQGRDLAFPLCLSCSR
jgi:hypothetical protein